MAKQQRITSDRQIASLKADGKAFEASVGETRGLVLRVSVAGSKSFEFRYTSQSGKRRRLPLGAYPGLTLARARERAQELGVEVVRGEDPSAARQAERQAARTGETLSDLAEAYFEAAPKGLHGGRGSPKRISTLGAERSRWKLHIEPSLGARRFREIKRADVKSFMRKHATAGQLSADSIASIGATLSAILAFAVHEEHIETNPATGVTRPLALRSRERFFNEDELCTLWSALSGNSREDHAGREAGSGLTPKMSYTQLALQFCLLTLARRGEVAGARWAEIDHRARTWTVPAERSKSRRAHVVPLSLPALEILSVAEKLGREGFIFRSTTKPGGHTDEHAMTRAVSRICDRYGLPRGSPHDFRRAGATTLTSEQLGFRRFIVSKVLGHSASEGAAVTAVYDRNEYLSEKRAALDAWASYVVRLGGRSSTAA